MKAFLAKLWGLPVIVRLIIAGAVLLGLLLLTSWGRDKVFNVRSWLFDRSQAAKTAQDLALEKKSDEAIKRAEKAEAIGAEALKHGAEKDVEIAALKGLIEDRGGKILDEQKRLEAELEKIKQGAGNCAQMADKAEQIKCVCAKLKARGFDCE